MTNNEKLARWAGNALHTTTFREYKLEIEGTTGEFIYKRCSCGKVSRLGKKYNDEDMRPLCEGIIPDYENTNAAMDLLDVLVEKEYQFELTGDGEDKTYWFELSKDSKYFDSNGWLPCKYKAITIAILELIESEASNERVCRVVRNS